MNEVTPENMERVSIKRGWLIQQFAYYVLGTAIEDQHTLELPDGELITLNMDFAAALENWDELIFQKNKQYGDAWQKDGPITSLVDLKDKLYRLHSARPNGATIVWDQDKLMGILYDIMVRSIMCLAWYQLNFDDDDDDRRGG